MKRKHVMTICALVLAVVLLCSGCASLVQKFENEELRRYTENMLDALLADDYQAAWHLAEGACTEDEFVAAYGDMRNILGDAEGYELHMLSIYTNSSITNGERFSTTQATYEVTADSGRFIVYISVSDPGGLSGFRLLPYEKSDYYVTGTLGTMGDANGIQWAFLLVNVLSVGVAVAAVVDCCRHKIGKKWLWILLAALGFVSAGVSLSATGLRMNFNVAWLTAYSALIRYGSGGLVIRVMVPVGAVAYWCARSALLKGPAPAQTQPVIWQETGWDVPPQPEAENEYEG